MHEEKLSSHRYRGPPQQMPPQRPMDRDRSHGDYDDDIKRPAIISDRDLKEFDEILRTEPNDGGWAGAQGEIDYRSVTLILLLSYLVIFRSHPIRSLSLAQIWCHYDTVECF